MRDDPMLRLLFCITKALTSDMACHVLTEMSPGGSLMTTTSETSMQRKCRRFCQMQFYNVVLCVVSLNNWDTTHALTGR